jgi:hypothetical protein
VSAERWLDNADEWRTKAKEPTDNVHYQLFCWKEVAFCEFMYRMMSDPDANRERVFARRSDS